MGSGGALTRADLAGARSGSGRPESGKKALPRPPEWFWRGCGEVWWARWLHNVSGALFIGGRGRCRGRNISGEGLRRGRGRTGGLGGWASSDWSTGSIPRLSSIAFGLLRGFDGTGLTGSSAAESALCATQATATVLQRARRGKMNTRRPPVAWAVRSGAVLQGLSLMAATGGTVIAALAGDDGTAQHRHPRPANRPCGARIRRGSSEQEAKRGTGEIGDGRLKKTTPTTEAQR